MSYGSDILEVKKNAGIYAYKQLSQEQLQEIIDEAEEEGEEPPECQICLIPFGKSETTGAVRSNIMDIKDDILAFLKHDA